MPGNTPTNIIRKQPTNGTKSLQDTDYKFTHCSIFKYINFTGLSQAASFPAYDDEFVGPFTSWVNVKTLYGATGNGITDETAALQAAFDAVGKSNSTSSVVYIPPGTYRITRGLTMNYKMNVSVIGADPATTIINWDGENAGTMMQISGTAYSRFNRITWNGKGMASVAIDQSYNDSKDFLIPVMNMQITHLLMLVRVSGAAS